VQDSKGAQLHPELDRDRIDAIVDAGRTPEAEGYSGFEDTELEQLLRDHNAKEVHIAGLALDYCVKATALDARRAGFDVVVHLDATRAIDAQPGDAQRTIEELTGAGVKVV
jgi:nicotinamidase/pyrazinamidase